MTGGVIIDLQHLRVDETGPATCRFPFLVKIVLLTSRVDSSPYHSASAGRHCWWFCCVLVALERMLRLLD